jgi:hypothetical protein
MKMYRKKMIEIVKIGIIEPQGLGGEASCANKQMEDNAEFTKKLSLASRHSICAAAANARLRLVSTGSGQADAPPYEPPRSEHTNRNGPTANARRADLLLKRSRVS